MVLPFNMQQESQQSPQSPLSPPEQQPKRQCLRRSFGYNGSVDASESYRDERQHNIDNGCQELNDKLPSPESIPPDITRAEYDAPDFIKSANIVFLPQVDEMQKLGGGDGIANLRI